MSPRRDVIDWLLLMTLVAMWGSSFVFIEIAIRTVTPLSLVAFRIVLAAVLLFAAMRVLQLPTPRDGATWRYFFVLILAGIALATRWDARRHARA